MSEITQRLKRVWKKLGIKGQIKNYSSKSIWVLETDSGKPMAHLLQSFSKSPNKVDADAFRRVDDKPIQNHKSWWKFYDFSTVEIFDNGNDIKTSVVTMIAVEDQEFSGTNKTTSDQSNNWGDPLQLVDNVRRNKKKRITEYHVTGLGWVGKLKALTMTCHGEIDNARPVFPKDGSPYIRTNRDMEIFNNLNVKG